MIVGESGVVGEGGRVIILGEIRGGVVCLKPKAESSRASSASGSKHLLGAMESKRAMV